MSSKIWSGLFWRWCDNNHKHIHVLTAAAVAGIYYIPRFIKIWKICSGWIWIFSELFYTAVIWETIISLSPARTLLQNIFSVVHLKLQSAIWKYIRLHHVWIFIERICIPPGLDLRNDFKYVKVLDSSIALMFLLEAKECALASVSVMSNWFLFKLVFLH